MKLKIHKIEKIDNKLKVWFINEHFKVNNIEINEMFEDNNESFLGTSLDVTGKYIVATFILRDFEEIKKYINFYEEKNKEKTVNNQRVSVDFEEENLRLSGIIKSKCEEICQLKQIIKDISRLI